MARCKECLYYDVCNDLVFGGGIANSGAKGCKHFKPTADVVEVINRDELLQVIKYELECINRQNDRICNNARDCENCDLRIDSGVIVNAYEQMIAMLGGAKMDGRSDT